MKFEQCHYFFLDFKLDVFSHWNTNMNKGHWFREKQNNSHIPLTTADLGNNEG